VRIGQYEHRRQTPISKGDFARRIWTHALLTVLGVAIALGIGVVGYHFLGRLPWIDSVQNAAMILGGMGPVDELHSDAAKLFAAFYALFSGLFFIVLAGFVLAPFAHRMLHHFHWEDS
jgi:hypothetical protein